MPVEITTPQELAELEKRLLAVMRSMIADALQKPNPNAWLTPKEVKHLLKISDKTFQRLKRQGILKCEHLGGTPYYNYADICRLRKSH